MSCSISILGAQVDAITMDELHQVITDTVRTNQQKVIANHNLHSLYLYHHDSAMREFYSHASCVHIDGMPLLWFARMAGHSLRAVHRVTYADWFPKLVGAAAQRQWRVFYLGSKPGVGERGAAILRQRNPGLEMAVAHGYFNMHKDSAENRSVLHQINSFSPHLLMIGMGMPRQEHWALQNLDRIQANVIFNSGAAMDYIAGEIPTPPRWSGQIGAEWLFRLASDPYRLWRRYLLEPWMLVWLLLWQRLRSSPANPTRR
jgi:N-acetylglucosaminyldiphosphoundecaprenol N-acetyl-beta-D-mannosaminyltransferase